MPKTRFISLFLIIFFIVNYSFAQSRPDALVLYRQGHYEEAKNACLNEISANPKNIESYVVLVWSFLGLEHYADAENYALRAYKNIRKDPRIVESLGEANYYQGKNDDALNYFREYVNLLPDGSRIGSVYYYMSEIYLRTEKLSHADISMCTALQYEPNNSKWWTRLGYIRERLKDWSFALDAYNKALEINPDIVDAKQGRTRILDYVNN